MEKTEHKYMKVEIQDPAAPTKFTDDENNVHIPVPTLPKGNIDVWSCHRTPFDSNRTIESVYLTMAEHLRDKRLLISGDSLRFIFLYQIISNVIVAHSC